MRWYEEHPEWLEHELRELEAAGFACQIDEAEREAGRLVLIVSYPIGDETHPLRVLFPQEYPYFAFHVVAPTLNLEQHQDPYQKTICLIAHADAEWSTSHTVASYLIERMPMVLAANGNPDAVPEAREGAPATGFMTFAPGSVVITSDLALPLDQDSGTLVIGLEPSTNPHDVLRGALLEIRATDGRLLGEADGRLAASYTERMEGRWVRLPQRPQQGTPDAILAEAISHWPALGSPSWRGGPDVVGIVFQDEARHREMHDIWAFVVRRQDRLTTEAQKRKGKKRLPAGDQISIYLARPDRGASTDLLARVPRLSPLKNKKVSIVGLGALGSVCAGQLARAGVGSLALLDHDTVDAGTIPRWLFGWPAIGHYKAHALAGYLKRHYPFVDVEPILYRLGHPYVEPAQAEQALAAMFDHADLILDCAAEFTVSHYLATIASERGIPYVWATGTPGSWGGIVGRVVPGKTPGCWKCFRRHQAAGAYPEPAFDDGPGVQPVGCFSPTFTGSGFDMDHVALAAVRMSVATLCAGVESAYPEFDWDVGTVDLWRHGLPIAPRWATYSLQRHPDCDAHG